MSMRSCTFALGIFFSLIIPTLYGFKSHHNVKFKVDNRFFLSPLNFKAITHGGSHVSLTMSSRCEEYADLMKNKPRWGGRILGPIVRYFNAMFICIIFSVILKLFNSFKTIRLNNLMDYVWNKDKSVGLLTVSNHHSFYDDPGVWAGLLPIWRMSPEQLRWSLCTEDVFFSNKWLTKVLAGGNVIPLDRSGSIDQPLFKRFHEKLEAGSWCHIFAEGKVRQSWRFHDNEPILGDFKVGVGKLIAHSKRCPIVIPMYHKGMDKVLPEVVLKDKKSKKPSKPISYIPRIGNSVEVYFGPPLDFTDTIKDFKEKNPNFSTESWTTTADGLQLYSQIACKVRLAVLKLEAEANNRPHAESAACAPAPPPQDPLPLLA